MSAQRGDFGPPTGRDDGDCFEVCQGHPAAVADNAGTAMVGRDRYAQCDDTCTVDCGACKGQGRPAASPGGQADEPEWMRELGITRAEVDAQNARDKADDVCAEELRVAIIEALRPAEPWPHAPSPEVIADALLPRLAPLLTATTGRGDDGAVERVLALAEQWDTDEDARYASARIARSVAARELRGAVAGGQDGASC